MRPRLRFPHFWLVASPYLAFYLGAVLNILAVTVNHGYMPVASSPIILRHLDGIIPYPGIVIDEVHRQMQSSDHLKFLCDWIQIPRMSVCSPGDLFLWLGEWLEGWTFIAWLAFLWRDYNREQ